MIERRRYPRFQVKVDARYRSLKSEDVFNLGITKNISAEGICFESNEKFSIGTYVALEVDLKDKLKPVSLIGEIRWFQETKGQRPGKKTYINGVKLVDIEKSGERRFLKYYCDRMVEKLSDYLRKEQEWTRQ